MHLIRALLQVLRRESTFFPQGTACRAALSLAEVLTGFSTGSGSFSSFPVAGATPKSPLWICRLSTWSYFPVSSVFFLCDSSALSASQRYLFPFFHRPFEP